ncbi:MAG: hypothetical protein R2774_03930 [Saprospiraceae bacterium]
MEEILKTEFIEAEKCDYLIELMEDSTQNQYIQITQVFPDKYEQPSQSMKLHYFELEKLTTTLMNFQNFISKKSRNKLPKIRLYPKDLISHKDEIIKNYLKGLSIKNLALIHNCKEKLINQILSENGHEVVDNDIKFYHRKKISKSRK